MEGAYENNQETHSKKMYRWALEAAIFKDRMRRIGELVKDDAVLQQACFREVYAPNEFLAKFFSGNKFNADNWQRITSTLDREFDFSDDEEISKYLKPEDVDHGTEESERPEE